MALSKLFKSPTVKEHLAEQQRKYNPTPPAPNYDLIGKTVLNLGTLENTDGEFHQIDTGIYTTTFEVVLDEEILDTHIALIGGTGSGKSSGLLQIISQIAARTDRIIVVVDGGGDPAFALKARAVIKANRPHEDVPILRLGYGSPGKGYNGFKGDALSIENRLAGLLRLSQKNEDAQIFHSSNERVAIGMICNAKAGPPQSLSELEKRLNPSWLEGEYKGTDKDWRMRHLLHATSSGTPYKNMGMQLLPTIDQLKPFVHERGHSLEDGCSIFSIDTPKIKDTAQRFFPFFVEDAKHCMGNRHKKKMVFVCDEYGPFEDKDLHSFASQARKHGNSIILATQSIVSLGRTKDEREKLLANTTTLISFQTDYPEEICKLAGSQETTHQSHQIQEGGLTGLGNIQLEDAWKIKPAEIKALDRGFAYVMRKGTWVRVHFNEIKHFPTVDPEPTYAPVNPTVQPKAIQQPQAMDLI